MNDLKKDFFIETNILKLAELKVLFFVHFLEGFWIVKIFFVSKAFQAYSVCLWFAVIFTREATLQNSICFLGLVSPFSVETSLKGRNCSLFERCYCEERRILLHPSFFFHIAHQVSSQFVQDLI